MPGKRMTRGAGPIRQWLLPAATTLVLVLFLPVAPVLGLEMPQTLIEKAADPLFLPGHPIPVQAMVSDPLGVLAVRCYFRYRPDADLVFIDLAPHGEGRYQGVLPAPDHTVQEVEYLFLAVNGRRQLVRTPFATLRPLDRGWSPFLAPADDGPSAVRTDLARAPSPADLLVAAGRVKVSTVAVAERFGLAAGLYDRRLKVEGGAAAGYFGAYELQADGRYLPVKGMISMSPGVTALPEGGAPPVRGADEPQPAEIIGPDIGGDTWEGLCYYGYGEATGNWYIWDPTPVTATILHEGNQVTLTLSTECVINFENVGQVFQGTMDWTGNMLLLDQRVPVQTWSSHWGPVTTSEIKLGDYVTVPTEEEPFPDYYVIELRREYPPPPPPPPPPNYSFLPAVYHLLLNRTP